MKEKKENPDVKDEQNQNTKKGKLIKQSRLSKTLELIVNVDAQVIKKELIILKKRYPNASNKKLAYIVFARARWKATIAGIATGLAVNPFIAIPAAISDVGITIRSEVVAAAHVALLYDDTFFSKEGDKWELLLPVFGLKTANIVVKKFGARAGKKITRAATKKYVSKYMIAPFKKIMLKQLGMKATQKGIITKTVPLLGGIIGGTWNWFEVSAVRKRTIRYFEGKPMK